jgi:site-specific DNA recombinase
LWFGTYRYLTPSFNRPGVRRLIEDAKAKRINVILVKDLSRFGRNYIEFGQYTEFVFPKLKVRYIAVNDNEDTDRGLSDFVLFKNLINEFMAKDTSRKIKGAFQAKFLNGERVNSMAPFGYVKHPDIKNKLMVDEETAWIVRKIFDLAFHGMGVRRIAGVLMDEEIPCPGWFQYTRNCGCARFFEGQPEEK